MNRKVFGGLWVVKLFGLVMIVVLLVWIGVGFVEVVCILDVWGIKYNFLVNVDINYFLKNSVGVIMVCNIKVSSEI